MELKVDINQNIADYKDYLNRKKIGGDCVHLVVACMPKSGSTYLSGVLRDLKGYDFVNPCLVDSYGRREQELSTLHLLLFHRVNYVAQLHLRYSEATESHLHNFNLKPIILTRDIFDVVVSLKDFYKNRPDAFTVNPFGYYPKQGIDWDDERIYHFIADMMIPWYFNFYASWYDVEGVIRFSYSDINEDMHGVVRKIADYYALDVDDETISNAISATEKSDTYKNKAVSGRGKELPSEVIDKIINMARYYEDFDFTSIGIDQRRGVMV